MRRLLTILAGLAVLTVLLLPATGQAGGRGGRAGTEAAPAVPAAQGQPAHQAAQELTAQEAMGRELYLTHCASCHGTEFNGVEDRGPSLRNVGGAAAVQFVLTTGRMPLASPDQIPVRKPSLLEGDQISALVAYVGEQVGDTYMPTASVSTDQPTLFAGRELYLTNCAACHGANGAGAAIGGGYDAPSLHPVGPNTIAEAMYIGPTRMPRFAGEGWSQTEVNQVASYVLTLGTRTIDRGGLPIGGRGPVAEGFVAWIIGLGLLVLAARFIGSKTPTSTAAAVAHDDGPSGQARHASKEPTP